MYTIEQIEAMLADHAAFVASFYHETHDDVFTGQQRFEDAAVDIARQLLDTMRTLQAAQARIDAAAAIAERDRDSARWNGSSIVKAEATGWNDAVAEFRAALELE